MNSKGNLFTIFLAGTLMAPVWLRADSIETFAVCDGSSGHGTTSATCTSTSPSTGIITSAGAVGSLASGSLGAAASIVVPEFISGIDDVALAFARIAYDFAVSGGPASGTLVISGSVIGSNLIALTGCVDCGDGFSIAQGSIKTDVSFEQFVPGGEMGLVLGVFTPFAIEMPLSEAAFFEVELDSVVGCAPVGIYSTCTADSNFIDTLRITGAQVFDDTGTLVPGATVVSDSGFNPNAPQAVPEPATLLLLTTVLLCAGSMLKGRRAGSQSSGTKC